MFLLTAHRRSHSLNNTQQVIAIVEPKWAKGHFASQMQLLLSILLQEGHRVILLCPVPLQVRQWVDKALPAWHDRVWAVPFALDGRTLGIQFKSGSLCHYISRLLQDAEKQTGWTVDLVFITWLDMFVNDVWRALWFSANLSYPWAGIYFLPTHLRTRLSITQRLSRWVSTHMVFHQPNCRAIAVLDEGVKSALATTVGNKPVLIWPDATEEGLPETTLAPIVSIKQQAGLRPIVGLIGMLEPRKGLLTLLRAMECINDEECYFLVAGHLPGEAYSASQRQELERLIKAGSGVKAHFEFRYIEDPLEFNAYVAACDFLYMAYENFYHSSGILTKAAVFEKPVIVSAGYCMAERVRHYDMGLEIQGGDVCQARQAILQLADKGFLGRVKEQARFREYHSFHNRERLRLALRQLLDISGNQYHF